MEKNKSKKLDGYKEVVTEGFFPYKLPITDAKGKTDMVRFVATLVEVVPDHKECHTCKKYISKAEISMAPNIIKCDHKKFTEEKINERVIKYNCEECGGKWPGKPDKPYWIPTYVQEYMCFECYGNTISIENPEHEPSWYGVTVI